MCSLSTTHTAHFQVPLLGSDVGCNLSYADYDQVCQGLGGVGMKIEKSEELDAKMKEAFALLKSQVHIDARNRVKQ